MKLAITGSEAEKVAKTLVKNKKFKHANLDDVARKDLERTAKATKNQIEKHKKFLRTYTTPTIFIERINSSIKKDEKTVITGIQEKKEIQKLKELDFKIIHAGQDEGFKKQAHIILRKTKDYTDKIEKALNDLHARPDWDEYFFEILKAVSLRATCNRGRAGAIIVRDNTILSTGYVGAPRGLPHCDEVGHLMMKAEYDYGKKEHCIRTTHAEQNAIVQAANTGTSLNNSTIYIYMEPCIHCTKMIINAGIKRVVCRKKYQAANHSRTMLKQAGIKLDVLEDVVEDYK